MADLYDLLGLRKGAKRDEIDKAYRDKAKRHHPDVGGDTAQFQAIAEAYMVLSDPRKRERYDRGENPNKREPEEPGALEAIQAFLAVAKQAAGSFSRIDMIHKAIVNVSVEVQEIQEQIKVLGKGIKNVKQIQKRLVHKDSENSLLYKVMESEGFNLARNIEQAKDAMATKRAALKILKEYTYKVDPQEREDDKEKRAFEDRFFGKWQTGDFGTKP